MGDRLIVTLARKGGLVSIARFTRLAVRRLRLDYLRWRYDFEIVSPTYIAPTARFDFDGDGFDRGGAVRIESGLRFSHGAILAPYGGSISIGRDVFIGPYAILCGHGGLKIGNDVLIAAHTMIIPANHRYDAREFTISTQGMSAEGVAIEDDVWIGSGVRILDGVTIGTGAVVAAGAVVTRSVLPYSVVGGVPARLLKRRTPPDDKTNLHEQTE